jgi:putative cardiolipin synthase
VAVENSMQVPVRGAVGGVRSSVSPWHLVAVLALLLSACSSLPENGGRPVSHALEDATGTRLHAVLEPLLAAHPQKSGFLTLSDGEAAFAERLRLVAAADRTLDLQYYIWHDDFTGRILQGALLRAADRGVRVRLLLDDLDTAGKDERLRILDSHRAIEVRLFNPFADRATRVGDFVGDPRRINRRMHIKTLTADNLVTIFGGRNIGDEYFAATEEVGFSDLDVAGFGPVAQEVSAQFDLYWNSEYSYPIAAFYPDAAVDPTALQLLRSRMDALLEDAGRSRYAAIIRQYLSTDAAEVVEAGIVWSDWVLGYDLPAKVEARDISPESHLAPRLRQALEATRHDLVIVSPYFVPGAEFTAYLAELVERGVRVRVLTNSLHANDVPLVHTGYMRYRKDLLAGGVELYEYRADADSEGEQGRDRIGAAGSSLHAKFLGFDRSYLFIGSFNLDGRSVGLNTELGVLFESPEEASRLSERFDTAAMEVAYRVQLDDDGDLQWVTVRDGARLVLDREPDTSWWERFIAGFMSLIVPESQL